MASINYISIQGTRVAEEWRSTFLPNLFYESWMVPGVTYNADYTESAGVIRIPFIPDASATVPGKPGRDFDHKLVSADYKSIYLNNNYQESDKAYQVFLNSMPNGMKETMMRNVTEKVKEGINRSGLACLKTEGTVSSVTTKLTVDNFKSIVMAERASAVRAKARPSVMLASPEVIALILTSFGKEFTPTKNDEVMYSGYIGRWYGLDIMEVPLLGSGSCSYFGASDTITTVSETDMAKVDFILYDPRVFHSVTNLVEYRMIDDDPDFVGTLAQAEVNQGYFVSRPTFVRIKTHTTQTSDT